MPDPILSSRCPSELSGTGIPDGAGASHTSAQALCDFWRESSYSPEKSRSRREAEIADASLIRDETAHARVGGLSVVIHLWLGVGPGHCWFMPFVRFGGQGIVVLARGEIGGWHGRWTAGRWDRGWG